MSDLVAIACADEAAATRARENLQAAVKEGALEVDDVVVVAADGDGRIYPIFGTWE